MLITGVLLGALYIALTIGLTLAFGVMGLINVAHLDILILSAYVIYFLNRFYGLDPLFGLVIGVLCVLVIGLVVERTMVEPLSARAASRSEFVRMSLLLFFGLSGVVRHSMTVLWGGDFRTITTWLTGTTFRIASIEISLTRVLAAAVCSVAVVLLYIFLLKTKTGTELRALSQNLLGAQLVGIDTRRVRLISFTISVVSVALAGYAYSLVYAFYPSAGAQLVPLAFVIMVTGGLGSIEGTVVMGLAFGAIDSLIGYFYSLTLSRLIAFVFMMVVLYLRPSGILGKGLR